MKYFHPLSPGSKQWGVKAGVFLCIHTYMLHVKRESGYMWVQACSSGQLCLASSTRVASKMIYRCKQTFRLRPYVNSYMTWEFDTNFSWVWRNAIGNYIFFMVSKWFNCKDCVIKNKMRILSGVLYFLLLFFLPRFFFNTKVTQLCKNKTSIQALFTLANVCMVVTFGGPNFAPRFGQGRLAGSQGCWRMGVQERRLIVVSYTCYLLEVRGLFSEMKYYSVTTSSLAVQSWKILPQRCHWNHYTQN